MADEQQSAASISNINFRTGTIALVLTVTFAATLSASPAAQAQAYQVLYNFTGQSDGGYPSAGLTQQQRKRTVPIVGAMSSS
jgi:hypothetical protein